MNAIAVQTAVGLPLTMYGLIFQARTPAVRSSSQAFTPDDLTSAAAQGECAAWRGASCVEAHATAVTRKHANVHYGA